MAKKTLNITQFDGGRNSKYDPRDIEIGEIADAINIGISSPGFFTPSGSFRNLFNGGGAIATDAANGASNYTITDFTKNGTYSDWDNTALFAFAHDYEIGFKVPADAGHDELRVLGAEVIDYTTKGTGNVLTSAMDVDANQADGSETGNLYLKNVTQSSLTAVNAGTPWANDQYIYISSDNLGTINGTTVAPAASTSPFIVMGDGNTCDIYDDNESIWLKEVMTLNNGDTWDATGTSANTTTVHHKYFFADGALRMGDANFSNTNNNNKWFGHINREFLQNILEYDGTAKTRDIVKYNSWWDDAMAPAPPSNTNEKALSVYDDYVESYPSRGEKVYLRFKESSAETMSIQTIAVDSDTGLATATVNTALVSVSPGDDIVISGTSHGGEYSVHSVPSTTTFTFFSNSTTAITSTEEGSDQMSNGSDPSHSDWTYRDIDGNTAGSGGWSDDNPSVYADDDTASLQNNLATDIVAGTTYILQFTTATADLDMQIGGAGNATGSGNLPTEVYVERTTYTAGTHRIIIKPENAATHLWFTAFQAGSGGGSVDTVSLKSVGCSFTKSTKAISNDLKEKWIFGISFLYDGISRQESPVTVGWKDGSTQMDLGVSSSHVIDFRAYENAPECDISFVYDDVKENNRLWHPRKVGFKIYMKRVDGADSSEWLLFSEIDLVRGEWALNAGDGKSMSLHQGATNPEYEVSLLGATDLPSFNHVPLESYLTETFGVDESLTHFKAKWKTQAIINRVNWIGNVYVDGESYPDRLMKSPILRYDIFPNSDNFFVDVLPSDGDEITHLEAFGDRLLVFKKNKLIIVNVSGSLEAIESVHEGMGVKTSHNVCKTDVGVAWTNHQGIIHWDGQEVKNLISKKFETVIDWPESWPGDRLCFDSKARHLIFIRAKTNIVAPYGFIYDFFTESFFYHIQITPSASTGGNVWSNIVNVPHDNVLIMAQTGQTSSTYNVTMYQYKADATDTPLISGGNLNYTFLLKTKDYDFGEPGVKKKIYKIYVTFKDSNNSGAANKSNVVVAYTVNGNNSSSAASGATVSDSGYNHFKAIKNCTNVSRDTGGGNLCVLDDNLSEWTVAEMKPEDTTANDVNSFQLVFYNKLGGAVQSSFKVNDITIVYKMKKKK